MHVIPYLTRIVHHDSPQENVVSHIEMTFNDRSRIDLITGVHPSAIGTAIPVLIRDAQGGDTFAHVYYNLTDVDNSDVIKQLNAALSGLNVQPTVKGSAKHYVSVVEITNVTFSHIPRSRSQYNDTWEFTCEYELVVNPTKKVAQKIQLRYHPQKCLQGVLHMPTSVSLSEAGITQLRYVWSKLLGTNNPYGTKFDSIWNTEWKLHPGTKPAMMQLYPRSIVDLSLDNQVAQLQWLYFNQIIGEYESELH